MVSEKINQINGGTCGCHIDTGALAGTLTAVHATVTFPVGPDNTETQFELQIPATRKGAHQPRRKPAAESCAFVTVAMSEQTTRIIYGEHTVEPDKTTPSVSFAHPITHTRLDCEVFKLAVNPKGTDRITASGTRKLSYKQDRIR
jgi:hypothetical protein